ncbi:MAG: hypothetical protein XD75_0075 [Parcubacteria bacterium 33_209]|nr:MAG: hypothetical protein XD75_0075 [Parcubacteria bacterium 33_209]
MRQQKSLDKFKELLIYIVKNFNDNETLTETKLWKLLYFCDADFFEKHRETITGIDYYKNNYGATPDKKIIDKATLQIKDYVKIKKIKKPDGKTIKVYKPQNDYKYQVLSANEIEEARSTCEKYYRLSVRDISVLAHKDPPYLGAKMKERIDFNFVDYREDKDVEKIVGEDRSFYQGKISDEAAERLLAYVGRNS